MSGLVKVVSVERGEEGCWVVLGSGERIQAKRVLVTVSLAVLQSGVIRFNPPLPQPKATAIKRLGSGCIEKVHPPFHSHSNEERTA